MKIQSFKEVANYNILKIVKMRLQPKLWTVAEGNPKLVIDIHQFSV